MKSYLFLFTRFNLRLWPRDKSNKITLSEEWLKERFTLFENYCFPSVKSQTYSDYFWICLFDKDTPYEYKERISLYKKIMPQFMPYYLGKEDTKNLVPYLNRIIEDYVIDRKAPIVQIRLDNDDALQKDFFKKIIAKVESQKEDLMIYSFKYGYQYYCKMNFAMQIPYPNNHFLTMINKNYPSLHLNILGYNHYLIMEEGLPFTCFSNKQPMWLEVIHDSNVDNDVKMTLSQHVCHIKNLNDFGIQNVELNSDCITFIKFYFRFMNQIIKHIKNKIIHRN